MQNPSWWAYVDRQEKQRLAALQAQQTAATTATTTQPSTGSNWFTNMFGKVAGGIEKGFNWYQKSVIEPIAATVTSPFSPSIPGQTGNWIQREKQQYEAWKAPWGVKRATEMLADPSNLLLFLDPTLKAGQLGIGGLKVGVKAGLVPNVAKGLVAGVKETVAPEVKVGLAQLAEKQAAKEAIYQSPAVQKVTAIIKAATPARTETEALKSAELSRRVAQASKVLEQGTGEQAFKESMAPLKGKLPTAQFEAPIAQMTQGDADTLYDIINKQTGYDYFKKLQTARGLQTALLGNIPQPKELQLLEGTFGGDFVKNILNKRSTMGRAWSTFINIANIPRSVVASMDDSAVLMQSAIFAGAHPYEWAKAVPTSLRAIFDSKYAQYIDDAIRSDPEAASLIRKMGIDITSLGTSVTGAKEEYYASAAEKIPIIGQGIKMSERGFVTMQNKLRYDVAKTLTQGWGEAGVAAGKAAGETSMLATQKSDAAYKSLGNFINDATGRGRLGPLQKYSDVLGLAFFAPKLAASRILLPLDAMVANPAVRGTIAKDLVTATKNGMLALSLAKVNGADVEVDPRSTDFGKMRFGNTRVNFWGGFQPYARAIAQEMTGQAKQTGSGNINSISRLGVLSNLIRGKLSPQAGLATDILTGQTFGGQELLPEGQPVASSVASQAFNRLTPLFIQDTYQAIQDLGVKGAAVAPASFFGAGVQTYQGLGDIERQAAAKLFPGQAYETLNQDQLRQVKASPQVAQALAQMAQRSMPNAQQQATGNQAQYKQVKATQEAALKTNLDAGISGVNLRKAIQDFKSNRFQAYQDLLGNQPQYTKANQVPEDTLAEAYWAAGPVEDPATGTLDYATSDAQRQQILTQAKAQGIATNYITGSGAGTFRGQRFTDPTVNAAVTDYEHAQDVLKPYWDITQTVLGRYPQVKALMDKIATLKQGSNQDYARGAALQANNAAIARVNQLINNLKLSWRRRNPQGETYLRKYYGLAPIQTHR